MPFDVGPMGGDPSRVCSHCGSRNFAGELIGTGRRAHFTICCHNGKASGLRHRPFPEPPEEFVELLTATTRAGRLFRERVRSYNSAFAFLSVGADVRLPPG